MASKKKQTAKKKTAKTRAANGRALKKKPENPIDDDKSPSLGKWTVRQRMFVLEYMHDFNAAAAAVRAGYNEADAAGCAYRLKNMPHIKQKIDEEVAKRLARLDRSADDVINQMGNVAFADLRELSPDLLGGISDGLAAAIQSVKLSKRQSGEYDDDGKPIFEDVVEYRIADRNSALNMLGKVHKLLSDRADQSPKEQEPASTSVPDIIFECDSVDDG